MAFELVISFVGADALERRATKSRLIDFLESAGRSDYVEGVLDGVENVLTESEALTGLADDSRFEDLPVALFDNEKVSLERLAAAIFAEFGGEVRAVIEHVTDESWQRCWMPEFDEFRTSRFFVVPIGSPRPTPDGLTRVEINAAGGAFGTGQHATTRAIMRELESRWDVWKPGSVLDVGTGTGIFLIAAGHLGARTLAGTEISHELVTTAIENLEIAGFRGDILCQDRPGFSQVFDLIIANILVPVLHDLLPDLARLLASRGHLIMAGFITKERVPLVEAAKQVGLVVNGISDDFGWECVVLERA
jgi:ribosomal protein L11 methyltransferase